MANSIVKIGPPGGPFVEIDEVDGNTVFRVPQDSIDFDTTDIENILVVGNTETAEPATPDLGNIARFYDSADAKYKAKFDDGETVTIASK